MSSIRSNSLLIDFFEIILLVTTGENDCMAYLTNEVRKFQDEMRIRKPNCLLKVETRHLNIGDFLWIARSKANPNNEFVLNAICERKTYTDLLDSIISNQYSSRYLTQKRKLMFTGSLFIIIHISN
jgi:ERCC4-type nuclease